MHQAWSEQFQFDSCSLGPLVFQLRIGDIKRKERLLKTRTGKENSVFIYFQFFSNFFSAVSSIKHGNLEIWKSWMFVF